MCFSSHQVHVAVSTSLSSPFTISEEKRLHVPLPSIVYSSLSECEEHEPVNFHSQLPACSHYFVEIFTLPFMLPSIHNFLPPNGDHEPPAPVDQRDGGMKG